MPLNESRKFENAQQLAIVGVPVLCCTITHIIKQMLPISDLCVKLFCCKMTLSLVPLPTNNPTIGEMVVLTLARVDMLITIFLCPLGVPQNNLKSIPW